MSPCFLPFPLLQSLVLDSPKLITANTTILFQYKLKSIPNRKKIINSLFSFSVFYAASNMETKKFHNNSLLYLFSRVVLENFPSFPKKVEKQFSRNCLFIIYLLFKDRQINRKKTVVNLYHLRSRSWGTQCRQISTDTQSGYSMIIAHRKATGHTFMPENCTLITKKTGM